jgi:long-chain acyl-CoA synthetase
MLLGQDKRELGALVFPDEEHLAATGADADTPTGTPTTTSSSSSSKGLEPLLFAEVSRLNKARPDYHPEDHIGHIQVRAGHTGAGGKAG